MNLVDISRVCSPLNMDIYICLNINICIFYQSPIRLRWTILEIQSHCRWTLLGVRHSSMASGSHQIGIPIEETELWRSAGVQSMGDHGRPLCGHFAQLEPEGPSGRVERSRSGWALEPRGVRHRAQGGPSELLANRFPERCGARATGSIGGVQTAYTAGLSAAEGHQVDW